MGQLDNLDAFNLVDMALEMLEDVVRDDVLRPPLSTDLSYVVVKLKSIKEAIPRGP